MTQPPPDQPYGDQPYGGPPPDSSPYGAPQHGAPHHDAPGHGSGQPPQSRSKGMAIAALVLGIGAILLCWTVIGGIGLGLVAIVLGIIAASRAKKGTASGRGMAITGAVLGLVGLVLSGLLVAFGVSLLNSDSGKNLQDCLQQAGNDQTAIDQCEADFQDDLQN